MRTKTMRRRGFSAPEVTMVALLIMVATACVMAANRYTVRRARDTACTSNLQQLALSLRLYAADHDSRLPVSPRAWESVYPYFKNRGLVVCPLTGKAAASEGEPLRSDYLLNPLVQADDLPSLIIAGDDAPDRHAGRWIGVRLDGAVRLLPADEWATRLGEVTEDAEDKQ